MYEIMVTIHNSPNKTIGWGYLVSADTREDAIKDALGFAQARAKLEE